jgi:GDP/GTP exchange factor required for growth at low temperature
MECRDHHMKKSIYSKGLTQATQSQPHLPHTDGDDVPQLPPGLFGEPNQEIQDIVDLDLEKYGDVYTASSNLHKGLDLASRIAPASMQPTRTNLDESNGSVPNAVILQQSIRMKMLSSAQNPASTASPSTVDGAIAALPKHSTLSRYFVNAFGRLERWKRDRARSRNMNPSGLGACAAGFDADAEVGGTYRGDLLTSKEGLDMYLRNMNVDRGGEMAREGGAVAVTSTAEAENGAEGGEDVLDISRESMLMASKTNPAEQAAIPNGVDEVEELLNEEGAASSNHAGTSSAAFSSRFHPEVVSLDDYEFSDSDGSGYGVELPPGLRPVKRLPPRREFERNFELVGRESVSSLGGGSHPSAGVGAGIGGAPRHRASVSSELSAPVPGGIQAWQLQVMLDGHEDSDEEAGDVDAALRRLEGQIDASQQRHKESQVEGWLRTVEKRERDVGGDYAPSETGSDPQSELATPPDDAPIVTDIAESVFLSEPTLAPPPSDQGTSLVNSPAASNAALPKEREPTSPVVSRPATGNPGNRFAPAHSIRPQVHRSFILQYSSTQLAKQWCLVDRDLFLSVKFEDLTFEDQSWKQLRMYPDVTDWSLYMKERSKLKMKANVDPTVKMPSSITTSRLRFNMMVNFVASEIVLSIPQERIDVVSKFIRIAWVSCSAVF